MNYKQIAVDRNILTVDRHYYDLILNEEGFIGFFIWKTTDKRTPISLIKDKLQRRKISKMTTEEFVKTDEKNFFFKYEDIQGIVDDDLHKMFEVLTNTELIRVIFREISKYDMFAKEIAERLNDKVYKKNIDVKISVEQGYN